MEIIMDPRSHTEIAKVYGISMGSVYEIRKGLKRKYLDRTNAPVYSRKHHRERTKPNKSRSTTYYHKDAKITDADAMEIIMDPRTNAKMAEIYNVSKQYIHLIRSGKVKQYLDRSNAPLRPDNHLKNTEEVVMKIIMDPRSNSTIAEIYGIHHSTVWAIRKGYAWKHLDRTNAPTYEK